MKSLLSLPNELFQHVASLLPFSAFLRLGCVNRRPNHICNDRLVLHDIAKNVHYNINGATHFIFDKYAQPGYVNLRLEQLEWVDPEPLLGGTSVRYPAKQRMWSSDALIPLSRNSTTGLCELQNTIMATTLPTSCRYCSCCVTRQLWRRSPTHFCGYMAR
jgi:hypothetical protein